MSIHVGTDVYGRVKKVSGTPVVTKFAMFQFFPIYPVQSFYYTGAGHTETVGVTLLAGSQSVAILGIPLASVDMASVMVAYVRAVSVTLIVFGFIFTLLDIVIRTNGGRQPDAFAAAALKIMQVGLAGGTIVGLLTYVIPLTSSRERAIRRYVAEILVVSADPARVPADVSARLVEQAKMSCQSARDTRKQLIVQLIETRAKMAQAMDAYGMESKTDELLDLLKQTERFAVNP